MPETQLLVLLAGLMFIGTWCAAKNMAEIPVAPLQEMVSPLLTMKSESKQIYEV